MKCPVCNLVWGDFPGDVCPICTHFGTPKPKEKRPMTREHRIVLGLPVEPIKCRRCQDEPVRWKGCVYCLECKRIARALREENRRNRAKAKEERARQQRVTFRNRLRRFIRSK